MHGSACILSLWCPFITDYSLLRIVFWYCRFSFIYSPLQGLKLLVSCTKHTVGVGYAVESEKITRSLTIDQGVFVGSDASILLVFMHYILQGNLPNCPPGGGQLFWLGLDLRGGKSKVFLFFIGVCWCVRGGGRLEVRLKKGKYVILINNYFVRKYFREIRHSGQKKCKCNK